MASIIMQHIKRLKYSTVAYITHRGLLNASTIFAVTASCPQRLQDLRQSTSISRERPDPRSDLPCFRLSRLSDILLYSIDGERTLNKCLTKRLTRPKETLIIGCAGS